MTAGVGAVSRQGRNASWRVGLLLLIMLVLGWQSCLLQTHIHPPQGLSAQSSLRAAAVSANDKRSPQEPADCPLCQASAVAGTYLPSAPVLLAEPRPAPVWYDAAEPSQTFAAKPTHHWRSRAPPYDSDLSI